MIIVYYNSKTSTVMLVRLFYANEDLLLTPKMLTKSKWTDLQMYAKSLEQESFHSISPPHK